MQSGITSCPRRLSSPTKVNKYRSGPPEMKYLLLQTSIFIPRPIQEKFLDSPFSLLPSASPRKLLSTPRKPSFPSDGTNTCRSLAMSSPQEVSHLLLQHRPNDDNHSPPDNLRQEVLAASASAGNFIQLLAHPLTWWYPLASLREFSLKVRQRTDNANQTPDKFTKQTTLFTGILELHP
jgi:hypothetical protein